MSRPLALVLIAALAVLGTFLADRWRFRHYWRRDCTGRGWKTRFPDSSAREIREFLTVFVEAFAMRKSRRLKFEPSDQVLAIYRTRYPSAGIDMLELETLVKQVKKRLGVDLAQAWHPEITLGEVFERVRKRAA
jgi:hypothetical protein